MKATQILYQHFCQLRHLLVDFGAAVTERGSEILESENQPGIKKARGIKIGFGIVRGMYGNDGLVFAMRGSFMEGVDTVRKNKKKMSVNILLTCLIPTLSDLANVLFNHISNYFN